MTPLFYSSFYQYFLWAYVKAKLKINSFDVIKNKGMILKISFFSTPLPPSTFIYLWDKNYEQSLPSIHFCSSHAAEYFILSTKLSVLQLEFPKYFVIIFPDKSLIYWTPNNEMIHNSKSPYIFYSAPGIAYWHSY